jgi:bis(5'-nucleosyl)-tetraphosphatase (symmetrical)
MATYAIGDLQGCDREFVALLDKLQFKPSVDRLWLVGDLINRGPSSLAVMRRIMDISDAVTVVLGNHDLHFLAIYLGGHNPNRSDTFDELLNAPDADTFATWLRARPLMVRDDELRVVMTHAGVPHIWSLAQAQRYAREVETVLESDDHVGYLTDLYGNQPDVWSEDLQGMDRLRLITNYFTRMRLTDQDGRLNFSHKGALEAAPEGWRPWYEFHKPKPTHHLLFGHWAALEGQTSNPGVSALDTGCVWGRTLTAKCLETGQYTSVEARV